MLVADPQGQQNVLIKTISNEDVGIGCVIKILQEYDHFKKDCSNEECEKTEDNAQMRLKVQVSK